MNPSSDTGVTYFGSGGGSSADGGIYLFTNTVNAYSASTSFAYTSNGTKTIGEYTYSIFGTTWVDRAQVPDDADIIEITMRLTAEVNSGTPNYTPYVRLHPNSSWKSGSAITSSIQTTRTWTGDLDYWGVTHAEALETINATTSTNAPRYRFRVIDYTAAGQLYCRQIRLGVVYADRTGHILIAR